MVIITPFRWLLGIVGLIMSSLIFISLFLGVYDRISHSECGINCGFVINKPTYFNPIDFILVYSSKIFPIDYIIFLCLVFYIFICSLYGIIELGIKIFCFTIYEIRKKSTMP